MALNYPGPYQLRFFYTVTPTGFPIMDHILQLNVDLTSDPPPGTLFDDINAVSDGGAPQILSNVADAFSTLLIPEYSAGQSMILRAELWKFAALSFDATFISAYDLSDAGTSLSTCIAAAQRILTFRSAEGGIMKVSNMESVYVAGQQLAYGDCTPETQAIIDYILDGVDGPMFLARDTSYPIAFVKSSPGQNESLFRARFR